MPSRSTKILFKFRRGVSADQRNAVIRDLDADASAHVRPLFQSETDDDLSDIYVFESSESAAASLIEALRSSEAVEYAEYEPIRQAL